MKAASSAPRSRPASHPDVTADRPLSPQTPLLEFFEQWYRPRKLDGHPETAIEPFRVTIRRFARFLGREVRVAHLNQANHDRYFSWLAGSYQPTTREVSIKRLRSLWRCAVELGTLDTLPVTGVGEKRRRIFHPSEIWKPENAGGRTLQDYAENVYFVERPLRPSSRGNILRAIRMFSQWLGRPATIPDLERETMNRFLADYAEERRARTVKGRRLDLQSLWNALYEDDLVPEPPKRIRKQKVPRKNPLAWTLDELRAILDAAKDLRGTHRGMLRSDFYEALIRVAYDSGLRKGDLFAIRRDQIGADGVLVVPLQKTGIDHVVRLRPATIAAIDSTHPLSRECIFPEPGVEELNASWRKLMLAAGIPRHRWGQLQQVRRTSCTHVELVAPGFGGAHLGHLTPGMAAASYIDRTQVNLSRPMPPDAFGDDQPPPPATPQQPAPVILRCFDPSFPDPLAEAEELLAAGHTTAAAVLARVVLENWVRFIAEADQVAVDPPTFSRVVKALTLGRLDSATANRLRTIFRRLSRAAHGRDLGPERTAELLGRIRNLITTPPPAARMTGTG